VDTLTTNDIISYGLFYSCSSSVCSILLISKFIGLFRVFIADIEIFNNVVG
jgi:hypothetical protein